MDIITDYRISSPAARDFDLDLAAERARIAQERSAPAEAPQRGPLARRLHRLAAWRAAHTARAVDAGI